MSKINVLGTINDISSKTTVYSPIIEAVVNAVHAVKEKRDNGGIIEIVLIRDNQTTADGSIPAVKSVKVIDNGIGFDQKNRDSFDTYRSADKRAVGGKGFGRFLFLKYFEDVFIESVFEEEEVFYNRSFKFGKENEIIEDEKTEVSEETVTRSSILLKDLKDSHDFEKNLEVIARKILERILIYFIDDEFICPEIIVREDDSSNSISLENYLRNTKEIDEIKSTPFVLKDVENGVEKSLKAKVFKFFNPGNQKSKICLTAHNRVVSETSIYKYIPEFEDEFYETVENNVSKNYIVKIYVMGDYLDENVSLERDKFLFEKDQVSIYHPFSLKDIELKAAEIAKDCFSSDINPRYEKKVSKVNEYVNVSAPWHKPYVKDLDLSSISYNSSDESIDVELHKLKFRDEMNARSVMKHLLATDDCDDYPKKISEAIAKITDLGKTELAHYVFNRRWILQALQSFLKRQDDGKAFLEKDIHNLIFPMGKDSVSINYEEHNLWLLDERLVFSEYIASDKKISNKKEALGEPDLLVFDMKKAFRHGENEYSNPLTIFEFKRPKRVDYAEEDNPITQVCDYVEKIRAGFYEMPEGFEKIKINDSTPVFGYVVCDRCEKIDRFCRQYQLTLSADGDGYFGYQKDFKIYLEVISYRKLRKDAELRNKIFFKKLMLE